jgi:hypothetical protein
MHLTWARNKIHRREYGVFFKFFSNSLISKRPSSVTFFQDQMSIHGRGPHRAYFYFSFTIVKTLKLGKKKGETSLHLCFLNMVVVLESPLNMAPVRIYVLQLNHLLLMSHPIYMSPHTPSTSYSFNYLRQVIWASIHYIYGSHQVNVVKSSHLSCLYVQRLSPYIKLSVILLTI